MALIMMHCCAGIRVLEILPTCTQFWTCNVTRCAVNYYIYIFILTAIGCKPGGSVTRLQTEITYNNNKHTISVFMVAPCINNIKPFICPN